MSPQAHEIITFEIVLAFFVYRQYTIIDPFRAQDVLS